VGLVVREGVGQGGEMTQALYAHMNNKKIFLKFVQNKLLHISPSCPHFPLKIQFSFPLMKLTQFLTEPVSINYKSVLYPIKNVLAFILTSFVIFFLLLCWVGYIVAFTKVLTIYQIHHT
jgi:hypothetical protein